MTSLLILILSVLVMATVGLHLVLLRGLSHLVLRMQSIPMLGMGIAMLCAILGHLVEIGIFAIAVGWMAFDDRFGHLEGDVEHSIGDHFYVSALSYTSLGFGDIAPTGSLRLLAAVEAITGLVLIAWTASFAFLAMQRLWQESD